MLLFNVIEILHIDKVIEAWIKEYELPVMIEVNCNYLLKSHYYINYFKLY